MTTIGPTANVLLPSPLPTPPGQGPTSGPGCGEAPGGLYRDVPGENGERKTILFGTTCGRDRIEIVIHPDGSSTVTQNGETYRLSPEETRTLEVHTQGGDDTITIRDERAYQDDRLPVIRNNGGTDDLTVIYENGRDPTVEYHYRLPAE